MTVKVQEITFELIVDSFSKHNKSFVFTDEYTPDEHKEIMFMLWYNETEIWQRLPDVLIRIKKDGTFYLMHKFFIRLDGQGSYQIWERITVEVTKTFAKRLIDEYKGGIDKAISIYSEYSPGNEPLFKCNVGNGFAKLEKETSLFKNLL